MSATGIPYIMVLPGVGQAVGAVRRSFRDLLGPYHPALDDVLLCVSELMANALRHTASSADGGRIRVEAALSVEEIKVSVTDGGGARTEPRVVGACGESGRGLTLVDDIATEWGFDRHDPGTVVWFVVKFAGLADAPR
ncbi:MAG TPA: ATP-binding protein [Streptosporangiaceae bacterium]|nr:ATP-binding protein [Streptosporangiaceae bacterium]